MINVEKIVHRQKTDNEKIADILGYFWSLNKTDQKQILSILNDGMKPVITEDPELQAKIDKTKQAFEDWDMMPDVEDLEEIVDRELKKLENI